MKNTIKLGVIAIAILALFSFTACPVPGGGGTFASNALSIINISATQASYKYLGVVVADTSTSSNDVSLAIPGIIDRTSFANIVAGCDIYSPSFSKSQIGTTYEVVVPLYSATTGLNGYWTGTGNYSVYVIVGDNSESYMVYQLPSKTFTNGTAQINAGSLGSSIASTGRFSATYFSTDEWNSDSIATVDEADWFWFTPWSDAAFIYFSSTDITSVYLLLEDNNGNMLDFGYADNDSSYYFSGLNPGSTYYIKVWATQYGETGSYKIAWNNYGYAPELPIDTSLITATSLTWGTWTDGNFSGATGEEKWFKYEAVLSEGQSQYGRLYIGPTSGLYSMNVVVYYSSGYTRSNYTLYPYSGDTYGGDLRTEYVSETYYIKVTCDYNGTFKIGVAEQYDQISD